jgi:hypothetical protein
MKEIERETGIKFTRAGSYFLVSHNLTLGVPHASQILGLHAEGILEKLGSVRPEVLATFTKPSEELIAKHGPVNAVSLLLAKLSGADALQDKSLFGIAGFRTIQLKPAVGGFLRNVSTVADMLSNAGLPFSGIKNIKLCKDGSAIADIAAHFVSNLSTLQQKMQAGLIRIENAQEIMELPDLVEYSTEARRSFGSSRGSNDRRRDSDDRRGSFGDRRRDDDRRGSFGGERRNSFGGDRRNSFSDRRDSYGGSFGGGRSSFAERRNSFGGERRNSFSDRQDSHGSSSRESSYSRDSSRELPSVPTSMGSKEVGEYLDKLYVLLLLLFLICVVLPNRQNAETCCRINKI